MRLLIIVNVYKPDLGGGVLFSDLCDGLADRGFDVTVRCAYPYYPEWRDKTGENGLRIRRSEERGVRIDRFGLYIPSNPNALWERLLYEASFFASLVRRIPSRGEFDGIMAFCPMLGGVAYAAIARRIAGIPLWLNVQDLPAEAAAAGGISRGGRWMTGVQDALFNEADFWSTISPAMVERLENKRRRGQPLHYIPNWLHKSLGDLIAAQRQAHETSPTDGTGRPHPQVRLLYSGNLGAKQNLIGLCRILHESSAAFQFRIQADGSAAAELREWLRTARDDRFNMTGLTDEEALARALTEADFVVVPERPRTGGSFIPSKLIPAFASGTPVLAVCDAVSPLGREMAEHGPGIRFGWNEARGVADFLQTLDGSRYVEWQQRAADRANFYERDRILDIYALELRRFMQPELASP